MQAIIFDCFGVLTTDYWREFVARMPLAAQSTLNDLNKAYDAGFIPLAEYLSSVEAACGHRPELVEANHGGATKNQELLAVIRSLKTNYKIGLLSNIASNWITEKFLTEAEQQLFDSMIFSHTVKLTKPDAAIFELMAERLGVEPANCLMVDDLEINCEGAKAVGMQAVLYQNLSQLKTDLAVVLK
ncbi:MAG: HAD family phosphatase [Patescibacteria group bacterium]|nr:HAD family phosphatase [Patescibacteria group bacterium]